MSTRLFIVGMKPITVNRKTVKKGFKKVCDELNVMPKNVHYQGYYRLEYTASPFVQ